MNTNDKTLSFDVIRDVCLGNKGHYLGSGQTLEVMQTEYLYQRNDFDVRGVSDPVAEPLIGSKRKATTDGLYLQGTYGFLPRWQAGLRYDVLGLTNKASNGERESFGDSDRWTAAVTWSIRKTRR